MIKAPAKTTTKEAPTTLEVIPQTTRDCIWVVPYTKGLIESLKKVCSKHGVQVYFRGGQIIRSLLVAPKDKDPILKKSGVIYRYKCDRVECDEEYIGESSRTFGERFKEHQKAPSPIYDHSNTTGHTTTIENFSIVGREDQNLIRTIKETLYIRNNPSLNKTWANTLCLTYGKRFCLTSQNSNKNNNKPLSGYSICNHGINICQLFSKSHPQVVIPSTTLAITSAISSTQGC